MSNTKIKAAQFHGVIGHGVNGYFLITNGDGSMSWIQNIVNPTISSVDYPGTATAADPAGGESLTITGTNFKTGATVTIGGTAAPSVSFVSGTELTITTSAKVAGDYDIVITNTDGGTATFVNGISYNGIPSWTTASGSLGTFASDTTISTITLQASEPDAGTITFSITNGALPTGLSLTGANIDGTTSKETADTLYNFTVTAIDDENQSTGRAFSITVEKYIVPAPENFEIVTYTGNGGTQAITSKIGKSASFNGSSSRITTDYDQAYNDFSISFFGYFSDVTTSQTIMATASSVNSNNGFVIQIGSTSGKITAKFAYGGGHIVLTSTTTISTNTWYHVAITQDVATTTKKLFINGTEEDSDTSSNLTTGSTYDLLIGRLQNATQHLNGKLDQIRIFNSDISSNISQLAAEDYSKATKSTTDIFNDGSAVALYELYDDAKESYFGQAFNADGGTRYIATGVSNNDIEAYSFWFYFVSGTSVGRVLGSNVSSGGGNLYVEVGTNGTIVCALQNLQHASNAGDLGGTGWKHIYYDTNRDLYINGILATGTDSTTSFPSSTAIIGSLRTTYGFYNERIDDVRFYSSTLTSTQIGYLADHNISNLDSIPNLLAHFKLDGNSIDETGTYTATEVSTQYSTGVYGGTPTNVNFLGMAFQPDLVWIKPRSIADNHNLFDSIRGVTKQLISNSTSAESTQANTLTSFDSNGFTTGPDNNTNTNGATHVAWCWKAGGAAVSNTDGSITSTVSANQDAGFSIVEFTTPSSGNATTGHGLSSTPELIIYKRTATTSNWIVYHSDLGTSQFVFLNTTAAATTDTGVWSTPSSTTIPLNVGKNVNGPSDYIAYCFHSVDGYQKIGSYTGNGTSTSSTQDIDVGFQPRFVIIKNTSSVSTNWVMIDALRDNADEWLYANASDSTYDDANTYTQLNSNGFTVNNTASYVNASANTYIYLAIA